MNPDVAQGAPPPLKDSERGVLEAIVAFQKANGFSPSIREVAAALGISGTLAAFRIAGLCTKGWLRRARGKARGLVVMREIPKPKEVAGADSDGAAG